jgi:steroid delta-isomerase-like uncharacterized protein
MRGHAEVREFLESLWAAFPDLTFEVLDLHHSDEAVTAELMMAGTHLGSRPGVEASGKAFRCRAAVIFVFDDSDLVGVRAYYDTGTIARQLA